VVDVLRSEARRVSARQVGQQAVLGEVDELVCDLQVCIAGDGHLGRPEARAVGLVDLHPRAAAVVRSELPEQRADLLLAVARVPQLGQGPAARVGVGRAQALRLG
jgi:hypothetical protein